MSKLFPVGVIRVMKHSNISCKAMEARFAQQQWTVVQRYEGHQYVVRVPEGSEDDCVLTARSLPGVRYAGRDRIPL